MSSNIYQELISELKSASFPMMLYEHEIHKNSVLS